MNKTLGMKIKSLRAARSWTLKEFGEKCNLSAGYLSLVERDLTTINITSLYSIAKAFDMDISSFFTMPAAPESSVVRGHEQVPITPEGSANIYYSLAGSLPPGKGLLEPIIVLMKPEKEPGRAALASHDGEEFGYVLEGIILLMLEGKDYELYPGDSYHILSSEPHAAKNISNRMAKVLYVNTAKLLRAQQSGGRGRAAAAEAGRARGAAAGGAEGRPG